MSPNDFLNWMLARGRQVYSAHDAEGNLSFVAQPATAAYPPTEFLKDLPQGGVLIEWRDGVPKAAYVSPEYGKAAVT